jgi:DNA-binding MarR family transcriptional regulator
MRQDDAVGMPSVNEEIIDLVRQLGIEAQQVAHAFAAEQGLHDTDLRALLHVMRAENSGHPTTAGGLGAVLGITSGAVTGVVDRLVRSGYVERRTDERDRRKVVLRYAPSARAVAEEFFAPLGEVSGRVFSGFSATDLQTVRRFLRQMTDAMAEHARSRQRRQFELQLARPDEET